MQKTETKSERVKESNSAGRVGETRSLASGQTLGAGTHRESNQLSKDLAMSLMGLIDSVNKDGVTPETVNASCNAASQIYKILRLNYEMKKDGF